MITTVKMQRAEILTSLLLRDGDICMHPDCGREMDIIMVDDVAFTDATGKQEVTIDHWIPQSWAFDNGWTMDQVWDLDNLKLMHKACNASKGDLLPNEDGTLPEKPVKSRETRADKSNRPEVCQACNSGRLVARGQECHVCGSGPMPKSFPQTDKVSPKECDHHKQWCWACSLGLYKRTPAWETVLDAGFLDE